MKRNLIYIILIGLLAACNNKPSEEGRKEEERNEELVSLTDSQLHLVQTTRLERRMMSSLLKVNGIIDVPPQNQFTVSIAYGGYLRSTKLLPGMTVKKGETIATMEDQQYIQLQEDYLVTQSKLAYAEAEFFRQQELNKGKASSDKVFQQAKLEYNSYRIGLHALAEKLKLIGIDPQRLNESNLSKQVEIHSPVNGFVSRVNVHTGKYVGAGEILFELIDPSDLHLKLQVFEKDLGKVSTGQKVTAYSNHEPGKKYAAHVILMGKNLSDERTTEIHCHFDKPDAALLNGMYMNAVITVNNDSAYVIPEEAVVSFGGKDYVFVYLSGTDFQMTVVTIGVKEAGYAEILNSESFIHKQIVTTGAYSLLMKLKNKAEE